MLEDIDTDSHISDIMECEHEPDEEVHTFDKIVDDEFFNKCGKPIPNSNQEEINDDNDEVSDEDDDVVFPVFDENQEWDKMVLVLGMKFSNPMELKLCLTNYAVKNRSIVSYKWIGTHCMNEILQKPKMSIRKLKAKEGWMKGCRRVIRVDGCFLNDICRGQLLVDIRRDANNHIYPIAWVVVTMENKETWKWVLDLLIDDIGMGVGND
ncbi:unnamed protein product [Lactuca saligna]|uniref:MULE transposase domain-containing protein n=1 Tax=Lactuca saligna TaxID=75948 RepID=A0AA35YZB9_LACSI|nr:unnamed protein product [Lactuca saligna]